MALLFWQFRRLPEQPDFPPLLLSSLSFLIRQWSGGGGTYITHTTLHYTCVHLSKANLQMKRWKKTSLLRTSNCVCSSKAHLTPIYIAFQCQQTSSS